MSRHAQIFLSRSSTPLVTTNIPLDASRRLPQTPRPSFSASIRDYLEPVTPRSPSSTRNVLEASDQHASTSSPVSVRVSSIVFDIIHRIALYYGFCIAVQLKLLLWLLALGADETETVPRSHSLISRTRWSSLSAAHESSTVYSFEAPSSPGVAMALPHSLLDQILTDAPASPTASEPYYRPGNEDAVESWGSSSTAYEPSSRAGDESSPVASSPSNPYSYSGSSSFSTSVGGVTLPSEEGIASRDAVLLPPFTDLHELYDFDDAGRIRLTEAWDRVPAALQSRRIAHAFFLAHRYLEERFSELVARQRLRNGNGGGSAPF
ncbi:hypothetical protein MMC11_004350 [Xylographa trunciseda]|nr:hypothetical protein [Xylographa trunciseda]